MPKVICHHQGKYNIYTTMSDGFYYEPGLSLEELTEEIRFEEGQRGLDALPDRLERAHRTGHSGRLDRNLEELFSLNRAGENETHLSFEECIARFLS